MSAAIGAALAGARTITATSSQGLALMAEVVYIAAAMRAPIVMAVGNRALSGPINIHCDHSDSMLIRDSGVDPALRRERAGGVRPDGDGAAPRRASRRAAAGARLPGRLHDHALGRAGRAARRTTWREHSSASTAIPNPLLDVRAAHDAGPVRDARLLLRAAAPAGRGDAGRARRVRGARARVRRALRPPLPTSVEPYALDGAEHAIVCLGSTRRHGEGRRRRAARRRGGGRPARGAVVPARSRADDLRTALDDVPTVVGARPCRLARRRAAPLRRARGSARRNGASSSGATSTGSAAATCIPRTSEALFAERGPGATSV